MLVTNRSCSEHLAHGIREAERYWETVAENAGVEVQLRERKDISQYSAKIRVPAKNVHPKWPRHLSPDVSPEERRETTCPEVGRAAAPGVGCAAKNRMCAGPIKPEVIFIADSNTN